MKVYVAGSTRDVERVAVVQGWCRDLGHEITFDWRGPDGEIRGDGSWDQHAARGAEIATREIAAAGDADLVIVLFPPSGGGLGCWIEMGAALARGRSVWIVDEQRDSVFWQHPQVQRFSGLVALHDALPIRAHG